MHRIEYRLKNYLNKHDIYKDNDAMQTIIINSFVNEKGLDNDSRWLDKIIYCNDNFGLFAQYAQNNWKNKHPKTNQNE